MNKGVNRLAVFLGGLGALFGFLPVIALIVDSSNVHPEHWLFYIIFPIVCFLIPFGLVHAIAWVVRGFKQ
jgi:hypothetical protein